MKSVHQLKPCLVWNISLSILNVFLVELGSSYAESTVMLKYDINIILAIMKAN